MIFRLQKTCQYHHRRLQNWLQDVRYCYSLGYGNDILWEICRSPYTIVSSTRIFIVFMALRFAKIQQSGKTPKGCYIGNLIIWEGLVVSYITSIEMQHLDILIQDVSRDDSSPAFHDYGYLTCWITIFACCLLCKLDILQW